MLIKEKEIKEIYDIKHRNDNLRYKPYDYENNILIRSLSPFLFNNVNMNEFLLGLQLLMAKFFDSTNVVRNWKNYLVDKYYSDHID